MKDLLNDILQIDEVIGVVFLQRNGSVAFSEFRRQLSGDPEKIDWPSLVSGLGDCHETEMVFDRVRFYIRRSDSGHLVVVAGRFALIAMIRLNCDIVLPSLDAAGQKPKGLKRLFSRK